MKGKGLKSYREQGKLPVVVYGAKATPGNYFVDSKEFSILWKEAGESTLIELKYKGNTKSALIHEVATHPVSEVPIHADLLLIDITKPVKVSVGLEFTGVSPAEKNLGGIVGKAVHEIEIEVLPKELPHSLEVDLEKLVDFSSHITASDIKLPPSAKLLIPGDEVVASVHEPKKEEVVVEEPVDLSSIEVEKKGREDKTEDETKTPAPENEKKNPE